MSIRIGRINSEIQKSVSNTIRTKLKDPRLSGMITVTEVDCAKDLKTAKVFVSAMGGDKDKILAALASSSGLIRKELSSDLKGIRTVPELSFASDNTVQSAGKIDALLDSLKKLEESLGSEDKE